MRIISGEFKGRRIEPPKNLPVRPTTDLAKESLFNILNNWFYFDEISVLDLFSGTGSISYEFASRGCANILSVDGDFNCTKFISSTAHKFNMPITVIKSDAYKFLENSNTPFDFIFADPPYASSIDEFSNLIELVFNRGLLNDGGLFIIEHSKQTDLSHLKYYTQSRSYGGCVFSFFELNTD